MKKLTQQMLIMIIAVFLCAGSSFALDLSSEITIYDGKSQNQDWHMSDEDQEVEPGMQHGQHWDLEGFFFDGDEFYMVGGYDITGADSRTSGWASGDIFFDTDGQISTSPLTGGQRIQDTLGYEYAARYDGSKIHWYKAKEDAWTYTAHYSQNYLSNPWKMGDYKDESGDVNDGGWTYEGISTSVALETLTDDQTGFEGVTHYALRFTLPENFEFVYAHYTMECGNDNLMGKRSVPEPANMILLGTGLLGLVGVGRKNLFKD